MRIADGGTKIYEPTHDSNGYCRAFSGGNLTAGQHSLRKADNSIADNTVLQGLHLAYTTTTTEFHAQRDRLSEKGNQWDGLSEKANIKETKGAPNSMQTTTCKHTSTYM
jgi:hypothetical protein